MFVYFLGWSFGTALYYRPYSEHINFCLLKYYIINLIFEIELIKLGNWVKIFKGFVHFTLAELSWQSLFRFFNIMGVLNRISSSTIFILSEIWDIGEVSFQSIGTKLRARVSVKRTSVGLRKSSILKKLGHLALNFQ